MIFTLMQLETEIHTQDIFSFSHMAYVVKVTRSTLVINITDTDKWTDISKLVSQHANANCTYLP